MLGEIFLGSLGDRDSFCVIGPGTSIRVRKILIIRSGIYLYSLGFKTGAGLHILVLLLYLLLNLKILVCLPLVYTINM